MRCDACENEATVHDIMVVNGVRVERHLCERCAIREMGAGGAGGGGGGGTIADPLKAAAEMSQQTMGVDATTPEAPRALACGKCGLTFNEFKTDGKLGCASCYEAFVAQLGGILMRAHEGATHHAGKVPRRVAATRDPSAPRFAGGRGLHGAGDAASDERRDEDERMRQRAEMAARLVTLRKHLGEAVSSEQYERAARLRDEVRDLERELRAVSFGIERPETQA
jgi:protein arginine kinase activator